MKRITIFTLLLFIFGSAVIGASTSIDSVLRGMNSQIAMSDNETAICSFYINDTIATPGSSIIIPINLENSGYVKAFEMNFYYPEGFTAKKYTKTERITEGTTISSMNFEEDHYYRILAWNLSTNRVVEAGDGTILYITLQIPDTACGEYEVGLKDIIVSAPQMGSLDFNDISASLTVHIMTSSIELSQTDVMLFKGEEVSLCATVLPDDATNKAVNWLSNDESVAIVDENGLVTAVGVGKATITATTTDGSNLSASCAVTVTEDLTNYSNYLSMGDMTASQGDQIVIPITMTNTESIMSFQTDIFLPDGLELLQEDGEYLIDPSDRMTRTHNIVSNDVANGAVRVMCYSSNYKPFTGDSGDDLFYITVKVANDAEGDYNIILRNTLLTNTDFEEIAAPDVLANVYVKGYLMGDANGSGTVTVTDVVVTSQYVLEMNPQPFIFWAADVNADNNITVTDVSRIAWMVLNPTLNTPLRAPAIWSSGDSMSGEEITLMAGETRTLSIALDNEMDYAAFQFDLTIPEGLTASNFHLTDRAGSHVFDVNTLVNGKTRVLCYSPSLTGIRGHEGAVLTFDVTATSDINSAIYVDGIELVTTDCQTVLLDAFAIGVNSATAVNELATDKAIANVEYFNIAGQRLDRPESGVSFIVTTYTDGTRITKKIIK